MKFIQYVLFFLFSIGMLSQNVPEEFTYNEYLAFVKKNHPLVKQANLKITEAQANLLKARGAFDPKIEADYTEKDYQDKNYYSIFNGSFKIPTWYGVEIKAAFDNNEGIYLNPENTVPNSGLTSLGITVPVGQGLWINERMADLKKAKLFQNVNAAEQNLLIVDALYAASLAYINWKRSHDEVMLYSNYLDNAQKRYNGVIRLIEEGDKPAIDSVETGITLKNRKLSLENAKLKLKKSVLEMANYLWTDNNVPLEIDEKLVPEKKLKSAFLENLQLTNFSEITVENHPKLNALNAKLSILRVDKRLKANSILPKLNLSYNYLSEPSAFDNYRLEDYKVGVNFTFPLFLRKERAALRLAKIKIQDAEFSLNFEKQKLENKIEYQKNEITSFLTQYNINNDLVNNYNQMLNAEERLFELGESSIFFINSRENSLVSAQLNLIALENAYLKSALDLFQTVANLQ